MTDSSDRLVDRAEAAEILQTGEDRVQVMIEDGLLHPVDGDGRLQRSEVEAAREIGG